MRADFWAQVVVDDTDRGTVLNSPVFLQERELQEWIRGTRVQHPGCDVLPYRREIQVDEKGKGISFRDHSLIDDRHVDEFTPAQQKMNLEKLHGIIADAKELADKEMKARQARSKFKQVPLKEPEATSDAPQADLSDSQPDSGTEDQADEYVEF